MDAERLGAPSRIDARRPPLDDRRPGARDRVDRVGQLRGDRARHGRARVVEHDADANSSSRDRRGSGSVQVYAAAAGCSGPAVTRSAVRRSAAERASGPIAATAVSSV